MEMIENIETMSINPQLVDFVLVLDFFAYNDLIHALNERPDPGRQLGLMLDVWRGKYPSCPRMPPPHYAKSRCRSLVHVLSFYQFSFHCCCSLPTQFHKIYTDSMMHARIHCQGSDNLVSR